MLVVRDGAAWLRDCLSALAAQTYSRIGIVGVDNASTDGSRELLVEALGEGRVLSLSRPRGFGGSIAAAMALPVVGDADYVCLVHDDAELDPDVVARLVEAATSSGLRDVGVVGAKVVDHDNQRLLRDIGRSADRFGHAYTALQPGEIDQGQFDRMIEVLCVSSSAMLVSKPAWQAVGFFDERIDAEHAELDFCWRARLAGFRVVMTPLARVRHRAATAAGERGVPRHRSLRYAEDRAALAAMLKNYGFLSLAWLLPLSMLLALVRLAYLTLSRRFEEAYDVLAAAGWNIAHLPGTLHRRRAVQRARRVRDRRLRRFMESAGLRLPRWFQTAERILEEQRGIDAEDEEEPAARRLRDRTSSLVSAHPVVVASFLGAIVWAVAARGFFGGGQLAGGVLPSFPSQPSGFLSELASGYRTTGLGGTLAASPGLGLLGGLSALLFGSTALAQKVMLGGLPLLSAVLMYRALVRLTGRPGASVAAAVAYALSGFVLWAFSQGRLDLLVALAVLPAAAERFEVAFAREEPAGDRRRFISGLAVTIAVGIAFQPGLALAFAVLSVVQLVAGANRSRGLRLIAPATAAALLLVFPFAPSFWSSGGIALGSRIGTTDVASLARLALGPGPGTWIVAAFLPVAALLSFGLTGAEHRGRALRAMLVAIAGLGLAWFSAAGYLPAALSDAPVYAALATVGEVMLVGYGLASVLTGLGRESFGLRQIGTGLLSLVLGAGIALQCVAASVGGWAVGGPSKIPAAWAFASSRETGEFRVLWVGAPNGRPFPPPGGDPIGIVPGAGGASLRYGLTGGDGVSALDFGRTIAGPGGDALRDAVAEIVSGTTSHGGALLAPFGVRFVVAEQGELGTAAAATLDAQIDMDRLPAAGLVIYRNAVAIPPASVLLLSDAGSQPIASGDPVAVSMFRSVPALTLRRVEGGWEGTSEPGMVVLSVEFNGAWKLEGTSAGPQRAFGWATAFETPGGPVRVRYGGQLSRSLEMWLLAGLWVVALWITRKPVAR
ncbi:MAG: glycosyltransferase family 2 protein [Actinomycetota bacterium]|nr:glycosyltransferase family 2 protein [Actinomycetota bacterium]